MNCFNYFVLNGVKYGNGTKIQFKPDFYKRNASCGLFVGYQYTKPKPSVFLAILVVDGKTSWRFNNCIIDDLVWDRDVEAIVEPVYYIIKTDKDKIKEKKEQGRAWEYIWPGTIVYILSMLFITIFNERVWGWIAATILYKNYCYEQLSK